MIALPEGMKRRAVRLIAAAMLFLGSALAASGLHSLWGALPPPLEGSGAPEVEIWNI